MDQTPVQRASLFQKPGAWVDLALTLPIFLFYHGGVIFLGIQNASDLLTGQLLQCAQGDRITYLALTLAIGLFYSGWFVLIGRGQSINLGKFVQVLCEGVLYAVVMRIGASYLVSRIFAGFVQEEDSAFTGLVMAFGAGFYEELTYRVLLFGLGAKLWVRMFVRQKIKLDQGIEVPSFSWKAMGITCVWAILSAFAFSYAHYLGPFGDTFALKSFFFRALLGLVLTLIYVTRGFAIAVWTHALYDVWVVVL